MPSPENPFKISGEGKAPQKQKSARDVFDDDFSKKLQTESYEEAKESLDSINDLMRFRKAGKQSSFEEFYSFFENASALKKTGSVEEVRQDFLEKAVFQGRGQSPRVNDFYQVLLAEFAGKPRDCQFEITEKMLESLRVSGDLKTLFNPAVSLDIKRDRIEKRLEGYLKGAKALDRREGKIKDAKEKSERMEKVKDLPTTPPPARDESKPSMDEMERLKEGEKAEAIWEIFPAWGGYYKEQSFDTWDAVSNKWTQSAYQYSDVKLRSFNGQLDTTEKDEIISLRAKINSGQWTRVPVSYTHEIAEIKAGNFVCQVKKDQNGDCVIFFEGKNGESIDVEIILAKLEKPRLSTNVPEKTQNIPGKFSEETEKTIEEIARRKKGNLARARSLASYTMRRLKYSNDSSYNEIYDNHPNGYIGAIDEMKQADCDVANTYFAGLCAKLNIPVRHCVGHMVKGKDEKGKSSITSGTGHAWSEVWDEEEKQWTRVDATPPGDPQMEEENEKKDGTGAPGDYGEQEAIGPTDEELEELKKKLEKLTEELSYTQEERELAEATGIEKETARKIVKEIQKAEDTKLPNGEKITDVLSKLFNLIIESRKISAPDYKGPLRKREGGEEIDDVVSHYIGMKSGESDPMSRQKEYQKEKEENIFGGFDVYMIGDKSGSMSQTVDGEAKWKTQRLAEYLILSAMHRFEANLKRTRKIISEKNSLSVRTMAISFRDSKVIDEDKSLSGKFEPKDKVNLWQSLGNQGMGNGDVAALELIRDQIKKEILKNEKTGKKDKRLRMVVACSDGSPDDVAGVHRLVEELGKMGVVVVGVGLTETAKAVKTIFDTEFSRGDLARDINDLPVIVAKHLVFEAVKLFPEKSQKNAKKFIDAIVAKFSHI